MHEAYSKSMRGSGVVWTGPTDYMSLSLVAVSTFAGNGAAGCEDRRGTASTFSHPHDIAVDLVGDVLVAESHRIRKLSAFGDATTFAGAEPGHRDGARADALFNTPNGVATSSLGNIYVADSGNHCIRCIALDGQVTTVAGRPGTAGFGDGQGDQALFNHPARIAVDNEGHLIVADYHNHRIRRVTTDGAVTTIAGGAGPGNLNAVGEAARFSGPAAVAGGLQGEIMVSDYSNNAIRCIKPDGTVTTHASNVTQPCGLAITADGSLLVNSGFRIVRVSPAGDMSIFAGSNAGAGYADGAANVAKFSSLQGLAIDAEGGVLVTTTGTVGGAGDHRIRHVAAGLVPQPMLPLPVVPRSRFVEQMTSLLGEPRGADVTFVVGGEHITAHRVILSARSEYFARMLDGSFQEAASAPADPIAIQHTTPSAFRALLAYLYTDALQFDEADIVHVMHKAQEINEQRVLAHCLRHCKINLAPDNAIEWLIQADHYHLESLRDLTSTYAAHNMRRIRMVARASLNQLAEHPALMLDVLSQANS